jgi:putative ABC transport system ATP-binding protein
MSTTTMRSGTTLPPTTEPVLVARSLYRFYRAGEEETLALRGVSLVVHAGEMIAVAGPSGSGKSTLLACLAGLDEPDGGSVTVAGERLSHRTEVERTRLRVRHLGLLFQSANLLEHLTVTQNLALVQSLTSARDRPEPATLLAAVGLPPRAGGAYPSRLSGGEAARAGLAVALANDPVVLFADEPTGEVDTATEAGVIGLLRHRADTGRAVLVVTHSEAVTAAADRVVHLLDGQNRP